MRKSIVLLTAAAVTATALALTPAETNEVLSVLSVSLQFDGDIGAPRIRQPGDSDEYVTPGFELNTYEELFSKYPEDCVGSSLTPQERREIFEAALWSIPSLPTNAVGRGLHFGDRMLDFCAKHNQTNFLPLAEQILLSPRAQWVPSAREFFEKFAKPSEETYRFVERVVTNRTEACMTRTQSRFLDSFGMMLLNHRNDTSPYIISNGVRLIYRCIERKEGWNIFDLVTRELYPEYLTSSNRLAFAMAALDAEPPLGAYGQSLADDVQSLFIPVTNTLLNASEPLKVLDLSWLGESPKE